MKKILSLLMISVLMMTMCMPAVAEVTPRESSYFQSYGESLFDLGNQQLQFVLTVNAVTLADELGVVRYWIYQQDGDDWVLAGYGDGAYCVDVYSYTSSHIWHVPGGETYMVQAMYTCTIDGQTALQVHNSNPIYIN